MKKFTFYLLLIYAAFIPSNSEGQIRIEDSPVVKNNPGLYAIAITKNNSLVYEHYFNNKSSADLFNDQSLTKSVMSLLMGIAIDKGFISSLDERIVRFFPELKQDTDRRKQTITIRQIMNQASGLYHEDLPRLDKFLALQDPSAHTLQQPMLTDPGSVFHYSNAASHLLSLIITKATAMPTFDFANKFLFGPLGIERVEWIKMKDGYYDGSGLLSIRLSVADMNKIGLLVLNSGKYKNKQILSSSYVQELVTPGKTYQTEWGFPGSEYALCWYHKNYHGIPVIYGLGWGGQFNFIIPSLDAVITVNESITDENAIPRSIKFQSEIFPMILHELMKEK